MSSDFCATLYTNINSIQINRFWGQNIHSMDRGQRNQKMYLVFFRFLLLFLDKKKYIYVKMLHHHLETHLLSKQGRLHSKTDWYFILFYRNIKTDHFLLTILLCNCLCKRDNWLFFNNLCVRERALPVP